MACLVPGLNSPRQICAAAAELQPDSCPASRLAWPIPRAKKARREPDRGWQRPALAARPLASPCPSFSRLSVEPRVHEIDDALQGQGGRRGGRIANETLSLALVKGKINLPAALAIACHEAFK